MIREDVTIGADDHAGAKRLLNRFAWLLRLTLTTEQSAEKWIIKEWKLLRIANAPVRADRDYRRRNFRYHVGVGVLRLCVGHRRKIERRVCCLSLACGDRNEQRHGDNSSTQLLISAQKYS